MQSLCLRIFLLSNKHISTTYIHTKQKEQCQNRYKQSTELAQITYNTILGLYFSNRKKLKLPLNTILSRYHTCLKKKYYQGQAHTYNRMELMSIHILQKLKLIHHFFKDSDNGGQNGWNQVWS